MKAPTPSERLARAVGLPSAILTGNWNENSRRPNILEKLIQEVKAERLLAKKRLLARANKRRNLKRKLKLKLKLKQETK